jgi:hypothetical protein
MSSKEFLLFFLILTAWFVLNRWILPRFGVPTCLGGSCAVDPRPTLSEPAPKQSGSWNLSQEKLESEMTNDH